MKIVFSGAGPVTLITARTLAKKGHDVIIIEIDKEKIDRNSEDLDCSFVHGDAAKPAILSQINPKECDYLFCLTDSDQANIITALLGRTMGIKRVVPSIEDAELEHLCDELELEDTIIPVRTMSHQLDNMIQGLENVELSTLLKNDARLFSFIMDENETRDNGSLDLPDETQVIFYYRADRFHSFKEDDVFQKGDEIVLLTHSRNLPELQERWSPDPDDKSDINS